MFFNFFELCSNYEEFLVIGFFFFFSFLSLLCAFFVTFSNNIIYSLLNLVLLFIFSSSCLILCNVEFLAITYVLIYAGGIAVLFAMALMTLNIKKEVGLKINKNLFSYIIFFLLFFSFFIKNYLFYFNINDNYFSNKTNNIVDISYVYSYLIEDISIFKILYTEYSLLLLVIALLLLAVMIGCLMLCLGLRKSFKK